MHFAVYVFPVPLAPTNKKLPTGLLLSCRPDFDLRIHSEISFMASFCPTTFLFNCLNSPKSFSESFLDKSETGTPVLDDITS